MSRYFVESYDPETGTWNFLGSILLRDHRVRWDVEHALAVFGLYCPRGADRLTYRRRPGTSESVVRIDTSDGIPMVRMVECQLAEERVSK